MIKMYREKSKIKAERFDGSQKSAFGYKIVPDKPLVDALNGKPIYYLILTGDNFEDGVVIEKGDWIVNDGTDIYELDNESFNNRCEQLPVLPQYVADWIESCKEKGYSLPVLLNPDYYPSSISKFMSNPTDYDSIINQFGETVARAWLDGYQVEAQHD